MNFRPLTENYVNAVTVPTNIVSLPSPSPAIARLNAKRENEHNSTWDSLKINCQKYNFQIEEEIQKESDLLKERLEAIRAKIEEESRIIFETQQEPIKSAVFEKVLKEVEKYHKERFEAIDTFHTNLKNLERKRSQHFKRVLKEGYQKMSQVNYVPTYDLLNFYENEISRMNEMTLNNYRCYSKFCADLKFRVQEEIRVFLLQVADAKDKQKTAVTLAKIKGVMDAYKHDDFMETQLTDLSLDHISSTQFSDFPRTATDVETWSKQMKTTLDHLDVNAKKLISLYKTTVIHIFHRFFDELKNITDALLEGEQSGSLDVDHLSSEIYQTIVHDITQAYTCDVFELKKLWSSITAYMETNIQNTYKFLNGSAHLWDAHFVRSEQLKNLIFKELDLMIHKNDKASQNFDRKINTLLDKLRQDSSISLLDQHLSEANKFLDSIEQMYTSQCDAECKLVHKYWTMVNQGIDLLICEIDRFLEESAKNENIQEKRGSWDYLPKEPVEDPTAHLVPHEMKLCQYQVDAVNNWMFGLWEAIRLYMLTCRQELTNQAEDWMESLTMKLKKRLEVRIATHKPRYLKIKTMIYDVRLKELENHMKDLRTLEEQVKQFSGESHYISQASKENGIVIIENYERMMRQIEEKLKNVKKSEQVAACIEQTKRLAQETKHKLEDCFKECEEMINKNQDDTERMICNFSDSIKLFIDGGTYNRDEVKIYNKKIKKLKKPIPKEFRNIFQRLNAIKNDFLKKFQFSEKTILDRLELSKKEFEHNEHVCAKIKELQKTLRNAAYKMKFEIHRVDSCVDYYVNLSRIEIWRKKHFEIMKDVMGECLTKMKQLTNTLAKDIDGEGYLKELNLLIDNSYKEIEQAHPTGILRHNTLQ